MKQVLFCFSFILAVTAGKAQNNFLTNYVQPSPNAAALGKYVDYPVSYYTGVPDISVPLYELKDGAAHVPVTLSYHASGIRVSEVASWVGLGWCLNAGGMITRTVLGAPDEGSKIPALNSPKGYYSDSGLRHMPLLPHPVDSTINSDPDQFDMAWYTVPAAINGSADCEPDLYFFNFNGYSGKFVFDENRTPHLLTDDNILIKVHYSSGFFNSWVITTPDGAQYYFGENSKYETTSCVSDKTGGPDPNNDLPTSWYLTRIVYPNTKDTVYFNYISESNTYYDLGPETKVYSGINYNIQTICGDISTANQNIIRTTTTGYRLSGIQSKNYTINFIANTTRQDMPAAYPKGKELDSLKIYANGNCIKQYSLSYSYFSSSTATQLVNTGFIFSDTSDTKRLKLLSVKEFSGDLAISKPPYRFTYDETHKLPRRLSYDQDHWGYSNTTTGNTNGWFTPSVDYKPACSASGGPNRSANWPQMESATLLSVKDPLGSLTNFTFEPDSADNYYPSMMIGGLRINKIAVTDSVTGQTNVRKFRYWGGVLWHVPKYLLKVQNEYYINTAAAVFSSVTGYQGYTYSPVITALIKQSQSIVPMQTAEGNNVNYLMVRETFGNSGEGGYKEYNFSFDVMPTHNSSRLDISNFCSTQYVNTIFYSRQNVFMGNGRFNDIPADSLRYYSGFNIDDYYPNTPYQVAFTNGKLLQERTYDASGNILQSIQNNYTEVHNESYLIRGFKAFSTPHPQQQTGSFSLGEDAPHDAPSATIELMNNVLMITYDPVQPANPQLMSGPPQQDNALAFYKLRTGNSRLASSIETVYKNGKQMITTHKYGYESAFHTLQTSDTTTNSLGDSIIKKTYYSFDYANTATSDSVFSKMKARNMLLPVTTQVWKNNKLMSGTITRYKDYATSGSDTVIGRQKIYALDASNTLTTSQAGESIPLTGQLTTLVPNTQFTEKADFNYDGTTGRISEQNLAYDKKQALIWDNKFSLPLAVVDNASISDVAYNSFESPETGNWSYNSGYVATDATAPTGGKVYTLNASVPLGKTGLTTGKKYTLSYWAKSGASVSVSGGTQSNSITGSTINTSWTYKQVTVTATGPTLNITGSGYIDEVRLYPATAQMVTYTYDNLLRLINQCSANSTISEYEYDAFDRLTDIKDAHGNIVKAFEYNYGGLSR